MAFYELVIMIIGFLLICGYHLRKMELKERRRWARRYSMRRGNRK